jgi:hypothetical protein
VADQTTIAFTMQKVPRPPWVRVVIGILIGAPLLAFIAWRVRRHYVARLRLSFYYWVEDQPTWRVITFTRANDVQDLSDVPLRIKRLGKETKVQVGPVRGAKLLTGDGQEVSSWEMQRGERLLVQTAGRVTKAVNFAFDSAPPRPQSFEHPAGGDEDTRATPAPEEEVDWGFGKTDK